jgi:hypothetical protein
MPVIVKMQRVLAGHPTPRDLFAALCSDQRGTIICGWDLTEPELLAHFDGGDVAYFEMDQQPDGSWIVLRLLEDQQW